MKSRITVLLSVAILGLTACPRAQVNLQSGLLGDPGPNAFARVPDLSGQVDFSIPGRQTQADMTEIGSGATVSLIDTATGYTVSTTVSSPAGAFSLKFSNNWTPPADKVYYLEAIKGLKAGKDLPNRVNADLARARTLVWFKNGGWESVSAGTVVLNTTSTALCILLSLRSLTPLASNRQIDPKTMMGIMQPVAGGATTPSPYNYPNTTLLPGELVRTAYLQVLNALAQDKDPFQDLSLDPADPLFNTLINAPVLQTINALEPDTQFVGSTIKVKGAGFSQNIADNTVEFSNVAGGPVAATVSSVEAGGTTLIVTVPAGAVTGPIAVTLAGRKTLGPTFYLALKTGHEAMDGAGNLYVANETFGTISLISQTGGVQTFATDLIAPRNLVVRAGKLYATSAGSKKGVVMVDLSAPANPATDFGVAGSIADPRGIAFDDSGRCWVSDGAANKLWRIDSAGAAPQAVTVSGVSVSNPHGLAFGQDGKLYMANTGANTVLQIDIGTAVGANFLQGFSTPWGVAFDSIGNLYVSNNKGNSIYRWEKATTNVAPYADMPSPGGIVADRGGYLYAIDNNSNNVYRITPDGDSAIYASGISSPTGVAKVGNNLYVLSQANNSLMQIDMTTTSLTTLARGFNSPFGLAYDDTRDLFYVSNVGNGTISKVERATGKVTAVLSGTGTSYSGAWGISYRAGKLYVRSGRSVVAYDVTNFGAASPPRYESLMQSNLGLSKDVTAGANGGSYYIASGYMPGSVSRILRIVGDGQNWGSTGAANKMVVFKDSTTDANLNNPRDVAVDSAGNVWVINTGNGKLTSYKPDGTTWVAAVTDGISGPYGINRDATTIWVANNTAKTITGYNQTTGAKTKTITLAEAPRNLCIVGTTMWVATDNSVGRIDNYASTGTFVSKYPAGGYNDIEVNASGYIYVLAGAGRRIEADFTTDSAWYSNYQGPHFMWQGGGDMWITDSIRFTHSGMGDWGYRLIGATDWFTGPSHAGVDSNGNIYLNACSICSADVVNRIKPVTLQEEWSYQLWNPITCWVPNTGAFAYDNQGNFFASKYSGLEIVVVDAAGNYRWLGGRSSDHSTYGSWVEADGTQLYQTVQSHHRVERVRVSDGARTILPYGLSAAEM